MDVMTNGKDKEANKGKHQYISANTREAPRANISSKGIMKRNIVEILTVHKKDGNIWTKTHDRPMLGVWDCEKVGGTRMKYSL